MSLNDPQILGFNLSAFVSAARSVTLFMQTECSESLHFNKWYESKQEEMRNDFTTKFFNELRRYTIHIHSIKMKRDISVKINEPPISISESVAVQVIRNGRVIQHSSSPQTNSATSGNASDTCSTQEIKMHFEERPQDDGIELCESHLMRIEQLVEECSRIVNSGPSS